jgi:serine protease AprX
MIRTIIPCLVLLLTAPLSLASEAWLRVTDPSPELRQQLPAEAISYEHFIWLPAAALPAGQALLQGHQVVSFERPFHHRLDDQWLDLSAQRLPAGDWFTATPASVDLYVLQFAGPIKPEWLAEVQQQGVQLISPLAPFSWIVRAAEARVPVMNQMAVVRQVSPLIPAFKVQQDNRFLSGTAVPTMGLVVTEAYQQTATAIEALGGVMHSVRPLTDSLSVVNLLLDGDRYLSAARTPGLLTLQRSDPTGGPRGEMSQQSIANDYAGQGLVTPGWNTWLSNAGLDGSGVTVSVVDGGIFENHPDLSNVVACTGTGLSCADSTNSHGTHVAGAIGGTGVNGTTDANGFNRGLGVAPGVQIVEQLYSPLLDFGEPGGMAAGSMLSIYKDAQTSGSLLSNNSWGPTGTPQGYDIPTMEIDFISRDANPDVPGNQPVLAVWSIMNGGGDGGGSCSPSSLGSPDEAKNLFAVGSTSLQAGDLSQVANVFNISGNSAHGPACDGRQVPHIVAPGCNTDAPDSASGYGLKCGTSMASPVISGSVSLYWQQYRLNHGSNPSPALIKAAFTAVADDLEGNNDADGNLLGHAPDRKQGWGRVNLEQVIHPTHAVYLTDQATVFTMSGQQWQVQLTPDDPQQPVRMMLSWTDAPGSGLGGTNPAWVNDLDLSVQAGQTFLGNQFGTDAYSTTGGNPDGINNMEGVFLRNDQHAGNPFTVTVTAANIAADALNPHAPGAPQQDFALVCYNCQAQPLVDLIFSDGFEPLPADLIFANGFD